MNNTSVIHQNPLYGLAMKYKVFITTLILLSTACLSPQRMYPEKRYYYLETTQAPVISQMLYPEVLRIAKIRMSPACTGKGFIYKTSHITYDTDFYHEFLVSPDMMFAEIIRQWFDKSNLFKRVTGSSGHFEERYIIESTVTSLHGEFSDPENPKAVLHIQFFLIKDNGLKYELMIKKNYASQIMIKSCSPESLVQGWNQAFTDILINFQKAITEK